MVSRKFEAWRELPRHTKAECPKLFYNFSIDSGGVKLGLTDLVAIWDCVLEDTDILRLAKEQHTSIDPSESYAQLRVLLEKLQHALSAGNNQLSRDDNKSLQTLYLKTELKLPRPLKPLMWTFALEPQDASELAERLLRPSLHLASLANQKIDSLLRIIKDKDHVISRLLDKIENAAIDLSLIFPGITGLKARRTRVSVDEAQKQIPGLADFDHLKWQSAFEEDAPYSTFDQTSMSNLVKGCESCPKHTIKQHTDWLSSLPSVSDVEGANLSSQKSSLSRRASEIMKDGDATESGNDFETQPLPSTSTVKAKRSQASVQGREGHNTSSGDESKLAKRRRLGMLRATIGRDKQSMQCYHFSNSSEPDASPSSKVDSGSRVQRERGHTSGSETETASETDQAATLQPSGYKHRGSSTKLGRKSLSPSKPKTRKIGQLKKKTSQECAAGKTPRSVTSGTETETEADTDSPTNVHSAAESTSEPNSKSSSQPHEKTATTPRRLGRLGSHRPSSRSGSEAGTPNWQAHQPKPTNLATIVEGDREAARPPSPSPPLQYKPSRSRKKLHREHTPTSPAEPKSVVSATLPDDDGPATPSSATKPDDNAKNKTGEEHDTIDRKANISVEPKPVRAREPAKEETVEEKANRRRQELKKRLGEGNGAGEPVVRKKRKF